MKHFKFEWQEMFHHICTGVGGLYRTNYGEEVEALGVELIQETEAGKGV